MTMTTELSHLPPDDAERLEQRWGISIALDMLHDGLITPTEFLWLCEETAEAEDELAHCAA
ncbi:MAG TPA: hypothetical protein VFA84_12145 [Acidimicrobiales bacterium]|nr:hypothetical protein [Acidimicrobiales bacterium]